MTSHYLSGIVKRSFETVFEAFGKAFGNVYRKKFGESGESRVGLVLGEEYFFRTGSDAAVLVILKELSPDETNIEVISCAGGGGLASISYGAHKAYVHKVRGFLEDSGFKFKAVKEIPYFEGDTTPEGAKPPVELKQCPYCKRRIPVTWEECEYCGAKQSKEGVSSSLIR